MGDKKRVVLSGLFYPVAILRYFESALENRDDVELITVGPYTENWIPWSSGMDLPEKYAKSPTIPLAKHMWTTRSMNPSFLFNDPQLEDVDLWIQCDAGFYFNGKLPAKHQVHIATDPHVLNYDQQRNFADKFFNMQQYYIDSKGRPTDIYLPYCASKYHHYKEDLETEYDVCLVGLQYNQRSELVAALRREGISVHYTLGLGMDEYRTAYSKSRVAISWSSLEDLIARVFEAGMMGLPLVTNVVPDLSRHFDSRDLLTFTDVSSAVAQVKWCLENMEEANKMAKEMQDKVYSYHTYDHRIQQIFDEVGF